MMLKMKKELVLFLHDVLIPCVIPELFLRENFFSFSKRGSKC